MLSYFLYSYGADSVGMCRCHEESEGILLVDFERATLVRFVRSFGEHVIEERKQRIRFELFFPFRK